jgi:hypothetical protein
MMGMTDPYRSQGMGGGGGDYGNPGEKRKLEASSMIATGPK